MISATLDDLGFVTGTYRSTNFKFAENNCAIHYHNDKQLGTTVEMSASVKTCKRTTDRKYAGVSAFKSEKCEGRGFERRKFNKPLYKSKWYLISHILINIT